MSELNPNHPVTAAVHDHWHKLCALLLHKFAAGHAVITARDVGGMTDLFANEGGPTIVVQETERGLELTIISGRQAVRLARQQGGLPQ